MNASRYNCRQITNIPSNLSKFYPKTYYSFNSKTTLPIEKPAIRKVLEQLRVRSALFDRNFKLAKFASLLVDLPPELHAIGPLLRKSHVKSFSARFLDVGCGSSSSRLNNLKALGFYNLFGADPYIERDIKNNGISILKASIEDPSDKYDLVTLHHSLEHIPNQAETLKSIRSVLTPDGLCLIRIPLVSSLVWGQYGTDWVELDSPRHLYLHSFESMKYLATEQGFELVNFFNDSTEFEFWGSEQYRRNIPLMAEESFCVNPTKSNFTYREMSEFKRRAEEAVNTGRGGRGCFFFKVKSAK